MYKVEEYASENIKFRYVLSLDERKILADTEHKIINEYTSPSESIKYAKLQISKLQTFYCALEAFFKDTPGSYFLRTSLCSPKDAYYQLSVERTEETGNNQEEEDDEELTVEQLKMELNVLKVSDAESVILVLCHSERMYYDFEFHSGDLAVLLMPWKSDILFDTETRCFIKDKKLIGFSQYYYDLPTGYQSIEKTFDQFYQTVIEFIKTLDLPYQNAICDIAISSTTTFKNTLTVEDVIFIEFNPYNMTTDSGLFKWLHDTNTILDGCPNTIPFKYKKDGKVITITN